MKKNHYCDPPRRHSWRQVNLTLIKSLIIIMLLGVVSTHAAGFAQNAKITMDVSNMPLANVLQQLSMQSETDFIYNRTLIESKGNVSVKAAGRELSAVLSQILPGLGLEYTFDDNVVIIRERPADARQQANPQVISGIVVDAKGKPVVNASVTLKSDGKVGTLTDASGRFTLRAPNTGGNVLVVSFLGKKTTEYPYSGQSEVRIVLEDQVFEMGEVVVTGIFNKPKESFTGSAVMVTREELQSASGRGAIQAIANLVPGFNIIENNLAGSNPNNMPYVSIRGTSNIASDITGTQADLESMAKANQPLIIMNGFEISMETFKDLDENQIENVTILKDASAAAMYGTKGSNGVIVITTVKPEQGRLRVTYKGGIEIQAADLNSYNLMNSREKLEFETLAGLYSYSKNPINDKVLKDLYNQRLLEVERGVDTYWIKFPVHNGIGHTHSLTIDGGEANFRYGGNISYKNIEGTMKGNKRNTFNGNMYLQYNIDDFMFSNDLYVSTVMAKESPYGTFGDYSKLNQYLTPYDDEGKMKKLLEDFYYFFGDDNNTVANPLYNAALPSKNQAETFSVRNNFSAEWKITPDLQVRARLGLTKEKGRRDIYKSADHTDFRKYSEEEYARKGTYLYSPSESFKWDSRLSVNYNKTIDDRHMIFGGIEFSMAEEKNENYTISAEGLSVLTMDFIGQAASYTKNGSPSGIEMTTRTGGMAFTGNYSFDNRYTLEASGKYDGSSQFGKNNRFNWFWSVGAGWNLHHEEFIRDVEWLDYARFRISYGVTGDPVRRAYQSLRTYVTPSGSSYNGWYGVYIDTWGNPDLKMATQGQFNIGLDWEFFDRRIRLNFDAYDKRTENSIMAIDIPTSSGFSNYYANIGSVSNRGFDLSANFTPLMNKSNGLRFDVGFIMSHNKNKLMKISNSLESLLEGIDTDDNTNPSFAYEEGKSLNTIFVVQSKGIDPSTGNEIFIKKDGTETFTWSSKDRIACGTTDADIEGSINANARYKGFYLKVFFRYRLGGQAYNNSLASKVENINAYNNADRRALTDRWKRAGDVAKYKSITLVSETKWTSRFVMDNDIFELSTITFGYDVPREWSRTHLGMDYVSMQTTFNDILYTSTIKRERGLTTPFSRLFTFALTLRF